jgi:hypothetical protein
MSNYFDCTLYVSADDGEALEQIRRHVDEAAAERGADGPEPPPKDPPIDHWLLESFGDALYVTFTTIDQDASAFVAGLATTNPDVRFDLIQVEGAILPFPEGMRFMERKQITGVPLFVPADKPPDWGRVGEGIETFDPAESDLIDGAWDFLEAPPMGFVEDSGEAGSNHSEAEMMLALARRLDADLDLVRSAFTSAELATVKRPTGEALLALLAADPSTPRPEVYVTPSGIVDEWQPVNELIAAAVARLLMVGALGRAEMDAPMPL